MELLKFLFLLVGLFAVVNSSDARLNFTLLIITQKWPHELEHANRLEQEFKSAFGEYGVSLQTDRDFEPLIGGWALWPILRKLADLAKHSSWLLIAEPFVQVKWNELVEFVADKNPADELFIGRALQDRNPVIIHHFYGFQGSEKAILYPDFAAGVLLSRSALERIAKVAVQHDKHDFTIDVKHEFAKFVSDHTGIELEDSRRFCLSKNETAECMTEYVEPAYSENEVGCGTGVTKEDVFYAVKTFSGNHESRVVHIKRTWAKEAKYVEFYSDQPDVDIPAIDLGVPNVERGHCTKTFSIINHFIENEETKHVSWLVIADDDTLLSVPRINRLLNCLPVSGKPIIGERYAFGLEQDGIGGYEYPTGGAAMIISRETARHLYASCECPQADSPDDMVIGMCARRLNIPILHSAAFHQAQRRDYSPLYVQRIQPISFHKLEGIDPYQEYMDYLHVPDVTAHTEL